ncbi:MAG TPA: hypothetical protein VHH34_01675 [Pseudonocardiaceae bacterium]|nr:hypothetical protein [Pseudonocardiaceae bacterium]
MTVCALVAGAAGVLAGSGCGSPVPGEPVPAGRPLATHRALVSGYFDAVNTAAGRGSAAQERLFASTQHPDFRDLHCSMRGLTVIADPAYSTLHTDPDWLPPRADEPPRGTVYVVAATVTVQRSTVRPSTGQGSTAGQDSTEVLGSQIGSLHVVILDGTAYGFAPCPV